MVAEMTYELQIRIEEHYLYVCASGARTRSNVSSMAEAILDACSQNHVKRVLVDVRELTGRLSVFESYSIPVKVFPRLRKRGVLTKAVIVDSGERSDRSRFFESLARKLGFNIRIFEDVDRAIEWLCDGEQHVSDQF
jgi:hypothetical protein